MGFVEDGGRRPITSTLIKWAEKRRCRAVREALLDVRPVQQFVLKRKSV